MKTVTIYFVEHMKKDGNSLLSTKFENVIRTVSIMGNQFLKIVQKDKSTSISVLDISRIESIDEEV